MLAVSPDGKNFPNLSFQEREALGELKSDRSIVIKEADKGSAVVVWDREDYVAEANRQLSNLEVYEALDRDPTVELEAEVMNCVTEIQVCDPGLLDKEASYLQVQRSKVGRFFLFCLRYIRVCQESLVGRLILIVVWLRNISQSF